MCGGEREREGGREEGERVPGEASAASNHNTTAEIQCAGRRPRDTITNFAACASLADQHSSLAPQLAPRRMKPTPAQHVAAQPRSPRYARLAQLVPQPASGARASAAHRLALLSRRPLICSQGRQCRLALPVALPASPPARHTPGSVPCMVVSEVWKGWVWKKGWPHHLNVRPFRVGELLDVVALRVFLR